MTEYIEMVYSMNDDIIRETFHSDDVLFTIITHNDIQVLSCSQGLRKISNI